MTNTDTINDETASPPQGANATADDKKKRIGAAVSKMISAAVGEIAIVMSRAPSHKHYALADIEWMVLPAVLSGQFYVAEATRREDGARLPVAAITWAKVSADVDKRLAAQSGSLPARIRPAEWASGETLWIIDMIGDPRGLDIALKELFAGPWKDMRPKMTMGDHDGQREVRILAPGDKSDQTTGGKRREKDPGS